MRATESLTSEPSGSRRVYRRKTLNALCSLSMAGIGVAFTASVIQWAPSGKGIVGTAVVVLLAGGTAAFAWYLAVRVAIQGVLVDETGLLIRNGLRSHRLGWHEIDHFEYGRCDPWPRVGVAILRNGRRVAMVSMQRGKIGHFPERVVAELNRQLEEQDARIRRG